MVMGKMSPALPEAVLVKVMFTMSVVQGPTSAPLLPRATLKVGVVSPMTGVALPTGVDAKTTELPVVQLLKVVPCGDTVKLMVWPVVKSFSSENVSFDAGCALVPVKIVGAGDGEMPRFEMPNATAAAGPLATTAVPPMAKRPVTSATKQVRRRKYVDLTNSLAF